MQRYSLVKVRQEYIGRVAQGIDRGVIGRPVIVVVYDAPEGGREAREARCGQLQNIGHEVPYVVAA